MGGFGGTRGERGGGSVRAGESGRADIVDGVNMVLCDDTDLDYDHICVVRESKEDIPVSR